MVQMVAAFLFMAMTPVSAILRGSTQNMDLNVAILDMHPAAVSKLLNEVELRWEQARVLSLQNQTDEKVAMTEMVTSCSKVATAIVAGSEGDKDKVIEYMQDVCSSNKEEEHTKKCQKFSSGIEGAMSDDQQINRNELDLSKFCNAFWSGPVTDAATVLAQKAQDEAAEKAVQEEQAEEGQAEDAVGHAAKVDEQVADIEASMDADDKDAAKLLDLARQEEKVANEKESGAKNAEVKAAEAESAAAEADAQAAAVEPAAVEPAAAKDDTEALAAGDEVAEKIADKALEKAAETPLIVANTTVAEPKKATEFLLKNTTVVEPKKLEAPKNVTKNITKNITKKL